MSFFTEEKLTHLLSEVRPTVHRETYDITVFRFIEDDVVGAEHPDFDDSAWTEFRVGSFWGGYDITAWFRAYVTIPPHLRDKKLALRFLVGPRDGGNSTAETMLYVNGHALQAIDVWHEEAGYRRSICSRNHSLLRCARGAVYLVCLIAAVLRSRS